MKLKTFRKGGVHPDASKLTAGMPPRILDLPLKVIVPMAQHIGAPATPLVKRGDHVSRYQKIGQRNGFISADIHTSISGVVKDVVAMPDYTGYNVMSVVIEASEEDHAADCQARNALADTLENFDYNSLNLDGYAADYIRDAVENAGIVGMGGATFPSVVKLRPKTVPDYLIINGCECEPFLTCDDCLMRELAPGVVAGIRLIMKAIGAPKCIVGIENNKPEAIKAMRDAVGVDATIEIMPLKTKYPQGGEKQLVEATTGRRIPSGALPADVGVVVHNVATAMATFMAVVLDFPLVERLITVTGDISNPGNYLVAVGTPISELIPSVGDDEKLIAGGPMMGRAAINVNAPVTKGLSGLLVLKDEKARRCAEQPCIRCASCVDVCPMGLEPYLLCDFGRLGNYDEALAHHLRDCIECGSCSYICPSARPLLDFIRLAKRNSKK